MKTHYREVNRHANTTTSSHVKEVNTNIEDFLKYLEQYRKEQKNEQ